MTEPANVSAGAGAAVVPGAAPRALTPGVRRRICADPRVRSWWLVAVALVVVAGWYAVRQAANWSREAGLVRGGLPVDAVIQEVGAQVSTSRVRPDLPVELKYTVGGKAYRVEGYLPVRDETLRNGDTIHVRVDRQNPEVWTNRTEPPSLVGQLVGVWLLLPVAAVAAAVGAVRARRLRSVWVNGVVRKCVVIDVKQTATAPRSFAVRVTPAEQGDRKIFTVFVPQRLGRPVAGDEVYVVAASETSGVVVPVVREE
jgi:hypothetical protein